MNVLSSVSDFILSHGYLGIFFATMLEYACFPISSEILFPFIGYCASRGGLSIFISLVVSSAGALFGCSFCYSVGRFGEKFLRTTLYKKFPAIKTAIDNASLWFRKKGSLSVFFGRVLPLVRTYISFPAGIAKMNYFKFAFLTVAGASIWNAMLISAGFFLGEHWDKAGAIIKGAPFKIIIAAVIFLFVLNRVLKYRKTS